MSILATETIDRVDELVVTIARHRDRADAAKRQGFRLAYELYRRRMLLAQAELYELTHGNGNGNGGDHAHQD